MLGAHNRGIMVFRSAGVSPAIFPASRGAKMPARRRRYENLRFYFVRFFRIFRNDP